MIKNSVDTYIFNILTINKYMSSLDVIETKQKSNDCTLACTWWTNLVVKKKTFGFVVVCDVIKQNESEFININF